jgi:L-malate glycosyltransferase
LTMYGQGYAPGDGLASAARRDGLADGVTFAGRYPHDLLLEWMATHARVLLHTARSEACSIALLEAMSLGVPVVGGLRSGGVPWQLDDGKAGLLVDVEDPHSIAAGVVTLLADPPKRAALGEAGRARVATLFDRNQSISRYEDWFSRCLDG